MGTLSHQSFQNNCNAFWIRADTPATLLSPLDVVNNIATPTRTTRIVTGASNSQISLLNFPSQTNPVSIVMNQGSNQAANTISMSVGNINPSMIVSGLSVTTTLPIRVTDPLSNSQFLTIRQDSLSNSLGVLDINDAFSLNDGLGMTISISNQTANVSCNALTFFQSNTQIGGISTFGTGIGIGTSNFTSSPAIGIDSNRNITFSGGLGQTSFTNANQMIFSTPANPAGAGIYMDGSSNGGQLVIAQNSTSTSNAGRIVFLNASGQFINVESDGIVRFTQPIVAPNVPTQTFIPYTSSNITIGAVDVPLTNPFNVIANHTYRINTAFSASNGATANTFIKLTNGAGYDVNIETLFNSQLVASNLNMGTGYSAIFTPPSNYSLQLAGCNFSGSTSTILTYYTSNLLLEDLTP
jgi:hypothetical protein